MDVGDTSIKSESNVEKKTFEDHKIKAPRKDTPIAYFWDVQNISVSENDVEEFLESVRNHMLDFREVHFYAPASVGFINKNTKSVAKMNRACVDVCYMEAGKDKADHKIKNKIDEFFFQYFHDGWIVIITGDSGFYEMIIRYKRKFNNNNLVLIYDDRQKSPKIQQMADHAPRKIPISHFLRLLPKTRKKAKQEANEEKEAKKQINSIQNDPQSAKVEKKQQSTIQQQKRNQ